MATTWEDVTVEDKLAQLGEPKAEFAVRGLGFWRYLLIAPFLITVGIALEIVLIGVFRVHHYELLITGFALIVWGITLLVRGFRNRGLRVLVFPEGLVRLLGHEVQALC